MLTDDARLAEHAAQAIQRHSRRGWRLDASDRNSPIDGIVALCMALQVKPPDLRVLGWL